MGVLALLLDVVPVPFRLHPVVHELRAVQPTIHREVVDVFFQPAAIEALGRADRKREGGDVTIICHSKTVAVALRAADQLAQDGIAADVTYLPGLQTCAPGRFTEVDREVGMRLSIGKDRVRVTLAPGAVRDGETFVMVLSLEPMTQEQLDASTEEDGVRAVEGTMSSLTAEVAEGPVGPCVPVAAPGTGG